MRKILQFCLFLVLNTAIWGHVRLESPFSDYMVLQRGKPVAVWGGAEPGEKVSLRFQGQLHTARADISGRWSITLEPMKAVSDVEMEIHGEDNQIRLVHVQVGEVWLCGGQSNMSLPMQFYGYSKTEIGVLNSNIYWNDATGGGGWRPVGTKTIQDVSPAAYFFAREIQAVTGTPVGILVCAVGGSHLETWMSPEAVGQDKQLTWGDSIWVWTVGQNYPFIQKLAGYGIRGTIFYQGESNGFLAAEHYQNRFPALIRDWRRQWGQGDFPFLFVQLANYQASLLAPQFDSDWPAVRDAQRRALELPNTGMASAIDIGEPENVHPRDKLNVGKRLAFLARRQAYGENSLVSSGPLVHSMTITGNRVRLRFSSIGGGLVSSTGPALKGFAVAGEDNQYQWANAVIDGETVVVSHPHIPNPKNVRYGWADNPDISLYNKQALPASPFTTEGGRVRRISFSPAWQIRSDKSIVGSGLPGASIRRDLMGRRTPPLMYFPRYEAPPLVVFPR